MEWERLSPESWAEAVVTAWEQRVAARPGLRMVLPTGATPLPVFDRMAAGGSTFAAATIFLLDEFGGLPTGHPQRCSTMLQPFLSRIDLRPGGFESFDPEADDLEAECHLYQRRVDDGGLDLVILGLGINGHVGLNEPGSTPDSATRVVDLAPATLAGVARYGGTGSPSFGMTLGMGPILAAGEVWLLVTGAAKRGILGRVLGGPVDDSVPATHLRSHPNVVVWADTDALGPTHELL